MRTALSPATLIVMLLCSVNPAEAAPPESQGQFRLGVVSLRRLKAPGNNLLLSEYLSGHVSVRSDMSSGGFVKKAYFFTADNKFLVHAGGALCDPETLKGLPLDMQLKGGKPYPIAFLIPQELASRPRKWEHAVIVFGKGNDLVARVYPKDDLQKYDFPEKSTAKPAE